MSTPWNFEAISHKLPVKYKTPKLHPTLVRGLGLETGGLPGKCSGIRRLKALLGRVPPEKGDLHGRGVDRHEVEGDSSPAARARRQTARRRRRLLFAVDQLGAFLMIVPAQHDVRAGFHDAPLRLAPAGQAHALRHLAAQ